MSASHNNNGIRPLLDRDQVDELALGEVYDYWLSKRNGHAIPMAQCIDVLDFPMGARLWAILDVAQGGEDYKFRFVGTELVEFVSFEPTGRSLSELDQDKARAPFMAHVRKILDAVLDARHPVINGPAVTLLGHRKYQNLTSINLPLSSDGQSISQILTVIAISPAD